MHHHNIIKVVSKIRMIPQTRNKIIWLKDWVLETNKVQMTQLVLSLYKNNSKKLILILFNLEGLILEENKELLPKVQFLYKTNLTVKIKIFRANNIISRLIKCKRVHLI